MNFFRRSTTRTGRRAPLSPRKTRKDQLYAEWLDFHRDNPEIYQLICRFTQELINIGRKRYSMNGVFERIRWHTATTTSDKNFKMPQNHRAHYSRLWLDDHPEHLPESFSEYIAKLRSREAFSEEQRRPIQRRRSLFEMTA